MRKIYIAFSIALHLAALVWFLNANIAPSEMVTPLVAPQTVNIVPAVLPSKPRTVESNPTHETVGMVSSASSSAPPLSMTSPDGAAQKTAPSGTKPRGTSTNQITQGAVSAPSPAATNLGASAAEKVPKITAEPLRIIAPLTKTLTCSKTATSQGMRGRIVVHVSIAASGQVLGSTLSQPSPDQTMNQSAHDSAMQVIYPKMATPNTASIQFKYDCGAS